MENITHDGDAVRRPGLVQRVRSGAAVAVAAGSVGLFSTMAHAQFVPETVTVENIIDYSALATTLLGILAGAFGAYALVKLSLGVGRKVVAWFNRA